MPPRFRNQQPLPPEPEAEVPAAAPSDMTVEVWVGNVGGGVTPELLSELLSVAGPTRVTMPRDSTTGLHRGFAFGAFRSAAVAQYAISLLDGVTLDGQRLRVRFANPS